MVFVGERCYKIHRIMFMIMGFWPYQKPFIWRMQAVFFFSAYCCIIFSKFAAFFTTTCNMDCILKKFTYICVTSCFVLCYCSFYCNSEFIKQALKHMQLDWKMFENSDTIKIFEEYLFLSYIFALFAIMIVPTCASALMAIECKPVILDAIIPLNTSRPRIIEVDYELFLDKEEYFFLYVMHEVLGTTIGFYSILVVATCCVLIVRHSCATHKIARVVYIMRTPWRSWLVQRSLLKRLEFKFRHTMMDFYGRSSLGRQ
ncbi:uncharacterized protein LOC113562768 [Ooceraea biroi]|uniref:uncharacterized protein LOC113562768 n=1 Tax=Ooceraea biroi TaxID=2015173 RepID=UPI000F07B67A|nr:uncharacterized protein LOC113562768 [Ooceraea biroi]